MRGVLCPIRTIPRCLRPRAVPTRCLHYSPLRWNTTPAHSFAPKPPLVEGAAEISHSHFISSASAQSDFNPTQHPSAGLDTPANHPWEGKLSPTTSHLFKLILPLPKHDYSTKTSTLTPQPTAFLLHPSQPLSHLSRLIAGSLPPQARDVEITYLALTGQESDLDSHLRNAEEESDDPSNIGTPQSERQEGGPYLTEREEDQGRWQEVSWSQSTDLSDFIKQSCLNERFNIVIKPTTVGLEKEGGVREEVRINVVIPSFESRTRYIRKRLLNLTKDLETMTRQKKSIDIQAHQGARRLIVAGLFVGVIYWGAVVRYINPSSTFSYVADPSAPLGWDMMEPVTWTVGFGGLLTSVAFLAYHNREVSYSSLLDLSVTARQRTLYEKHGLDIDRWTEMVAEAKTLRKEIIRIAADYDIEWKGELENLASHPRHPGPGHPSSTGAKSGSKRTLADGGSRTVDIDKTIDEAAELASQSEEQREKDQAAQRKGEVVERDENGKKKKTSEEKGREKANEIAKQKVDD